MFIDQDPKQLPEERNPSLAEGIFRSSGVEN